MLVMKNGLNRSILSLSFHPIVGAVIGNINDVISPKVSLILSRTRVLVSKFFGGALPSVLPPNDCHSIWKIFISANSAETFAISQSLTDDIGYFLLK